MTDTFSDEYKEASQTFLPVGTKDGKACRQVCLIQRCKFFIEKNGKRKRCCNCVGKNYLSSGLCHYHQEASPEQMCNFPGELGPGDPPESRVANARAQKGTIRRLMFNKSSIGLKARLWIKERRVAIQNPNGRSGIANASKIYLLQFQVRLARPLSEAQAVWKKVSQWQNVFHADPPSGVFTAEVPVKIIEVVEDANHWVGRHRTVEPLYLTRVNRVTGKVLLEAREGEFEGLKLRIDNPFQEGAMNDWLFSDLPAHGRAEYSHEERTAANLYRPLRNHRNFEPVGEGLAYYHSIARDMISEAWLKARRRLSNRIRRPNFDDAWIDNNQQEQQTKPWHEVQKLPSGAIEELTTLDHIKDRYHLKVNEHTRNPETLQKEMKKTLQQLGEIGLGNPYIWKKPSGFRYKQGEEGFTKEFVTKMLQAFAEMGIRPCTSDTRFRCFSIKPNPVVGCEGGWRARLAAASTSSASAASSSGLNYEYPRLQPYQFMCRYICTPEFEDVIRRFLVVHEVGTGKTLTMLEILDNFFYDERAKIIVVPKKDLADNFLQEMLNHRTLYRDWLEQMLGTETLLTARGLGNLRPSSTQVSNALEQCKNALSCKYLRGSSQLKAPAKYGRDELKMGAPLRIYTYVEAGDKKLDAFWKLGHKDAKNLQSDEHFQHKVVLLDEVQNFLSSQASQAAMEISGGNQLYFQNVKDKIKNVQTKISKAGDKSLVYSFTATPIISSTKDTNELLQAVTGEDSPKANREGFVSYFMSHPRTLYAEATTMPIEDPCKFVLRVVPLKGTTLLSTLRYAGKQLHFTQGEEGERKIEIVDLPKNKQPAKIIRYETGASLGGGTTEQRKSEKLAEKRSHIPTDEHQPQVRSLIDRLETAGLGAQFKFEQKNKNAFEYKAAPSGLPLGENHPLYKECEKDYPKMFQMVMQCQRVMEPVNYGPPFVAIPTDDANPQRFGAAARRESAFRSAGPSRPILSPPKTLILMDSSYIRTFAAMLRCFTPPEFSFGVVNSGTSQTEANKATPKGERTDLINRFRGRENVCGEQMRFFIADAQSYSEGISFFNVRRLIIDLGYVNNSYMKLRQQVGRVMRAFGHSDLPLEERTVQVLVFASRITALGIASHCADLGCNPNQVPSADCSKCATVKKAKLLPVLNANASMKTLQKRAKDLGLSRELIESNDPGSVPKALKRTASVKDKFEFIEEVNIKYSTLDLPRFELKHNNTVYTNSLYDELRAQIPTKPVRKTPKNEELHAKITEQKKLVNELSNALNKLVDDAHKRAEKFYRDLVNQFRRFVDEETEKYNLNLRRAPDLAYYLRAVQAGGYSMYSTSENGYEHGPMEININQQPSCFPIRDDLVLDSIRKQGKEFSTAECLLNTIALDRIPLLEASRPNPCNDESLDLSSSMAISLLAGTQPAILKIGFTSINATDDMNVFLRNVKHDSTLYNLYKRVFYRYSNAMFLAILRFIGEENPNTCAIIWPVRWSTQPSTNMNWMMDNTFVFKRNSDGERELSYNLETFYEQLKIVIEMEKMFAVVSMIIARGGSFHSNVIIVRFDAAHTTITRFEPHGNFFYDAEHQEDSNYINNELRIMCSLLKPLLRSRPEFRSVKLTYISPAGLLPPGFNECDRIGVQTLEHNYHALFDVAKTRVLGGNDEIGDKTALVRYVNPSRQKIYLQGVFTTKDEIIELEPKNDTFPVEFYNAAVDAKNTNSYVDLSFPSFSFTEHQETVTVSISNRFRCEFKNPLIQRVYRKNLDSGLCLLWSAMFVHMQVKNPFLTSKDVHRIMRRSPKELGRMIRNYALTMYNTVNEASITTDGGDTLSIGVKYDPKLKKHVYEPRLNSIPLTSDDVEKMKERLKSLERSSVSP